MLTVPMLTIPMRTVSILTMLILTVLMLTQLLMLTRAPFTLPCAIARTCDEVQPIKSDCSRRVPYGFLTE